MQEIYQIVRGSYFSYGVPVYHREVINMPKQTAVRIPDETYERLQELAKRTGRSAIYYIREAIEEHLDDLEDAYLGELALSSIIIRSEYMNQRLPNIHPGEILLEEFLLPLGISQNRLARDLSVPPRRINEIVHGKRSISAETAIRLARYFGNSEKFWLGLQEDFNLEEARMKLGDRLDREVKTRAA